MRYKEKGEIHPDFHRTTNATIAYIREKYGLEFLDEIFRKTALNVYRAIHDDLKKGSPEHLLEHWCYFFDRENGDYSIQRCRDEIHMEVHRCPAVDYLQRKGISIDPAFCRQTEMMNDALAQNTPFDIETDVLGGGRCAQTVRRRST